MADDVQAITGTEAEIAARLCNFETAQSYLLSSHQDWLDQNAAPVIRNLANPWVDLLGYASRIGDAEFNRQLSYRRCEAVKSWLSNYSEKTNFQIEWAKGETESGGDEDDNSGYWRAVEVYVYGSKPAPPAPPTATDSTDFEIRVVGGASVGKEFVQGDGYIFQIVDLSQKKTAFFLYRAVGLAFPSVPPGSMTDTGPFTPFKTTEPVVLDDFGGKAELFQDPGVNLGTSVSFGSLRLSIESDKLLEKAASVRPNIIEIPSGWSLGAGFGSASGGQLVRVGEILEFTE